MNVLKQPYILINAFWHHLVVKLRITSRQTKRCLKIKFRYKRFLTFGNTGLINTVSINNPSKTYWLLLTLNTPAWEAADMWRCRPGQRCQLSGRRPERCRSRHSPLLGPLLMLLHSVCLPLPVLRWKQRNSTLTLNFNCYTFVCWNTHTHNQACDKSAANTSFSR